MFQLSLQSDLTKLLDKIEKLQEKVKDGPGLEVMTNVGQAAMEDIEERFRTRGYGTWVPLSPVTIARKGHDTILVDTGNMRGSVGISTVTSKSVTVTVPYGGKDNDVAIPIVHQLGTGKVPQRKIVENTQQLRNRINPVIKNWLTT